MTSRENIHNNKAVLGLSISRGEIEGSQNNDMMRRQQPWARLDGYENQSCFIL
jgi:hypothetical protein